MSKTSAAVKFKKATSPATQTLQPQADSSNMQVTVGKVSFGTRKDGSLNLKDTVQQSTKETDAKLLISTNHERSNSPTLSPRSPRCHTLKVEEFDSRTSQVYRSRQRIKITEDRLKHIIDRHIRENGFESFESSRFVITDRKQMVD